MAVLGPCLATIIALSNILGPNQPRVDNAGTMYALLDAQNRRVGDTPDPSNGRNDGFVSQDADGAPIVKIRSYQRSVEATSTVPSCAGTDVPLVEKQFKITMYRQVALPVSWKQMSGLCGDAAKVYNSGQLPDGSRFKTVNTPVMADTVAKLMSKVYKLVSDINDDLNIKLATKTGVSRRTGTALAKNYYTFKANDDRNTRGYSEMITDYAYNGFGGTPIMIGGALPSILSTEMQWGNLSASGTDYSRILTQTPFRFYLDKNADVNIGTDQFMLMAPGAAKLVTYNEYGGNVFSGKWGNGDFGQFTIPEFGDDLRFDLHVEQISCPKPTGLFIVSLYYDLYVSEDIFNAADPNAGVNGLIKGKLMKLAV